MPLRDKSHTYPCQPRQGNQQQSNTPATGAPTITGTAQVGETLTVSTSGISDSDGLTNATFSYIWLADGTEINGATSSTHTLVADDEGKAIRVKVSFTDDGSFLESVTSAATAAVAPRPNTPATGLPAISGTVQVGKTLTVSTSAIADVDGLSDVSYDYQWIAGTSDITGATGSSCTLTSIEQGQTIKVRVTFDDDAGNRETLTSAATAAVTAAPNAPATGVPTISGTAQVGQTLTADTSGIADTNGTADATFTYQWLSRSGNTDSEVSGATGATYTLVDADQGKAIKVRVSFTDDSGNSEELTSAATAAVAPRPPLTATLESEPDSHDGNNTFTFEVRFTEEIHIGYKRLRDHVFTVTAGDVTGVRRLNPPSNTGWEVTVEPDGDGEVTIALPATKFCSRASAICTENRKKLSNSSTVTVPGPATQSQEAQVENSPATGLPTITGTATVGNTLSVSMADVSDENGLTGASHSYQWMADEVNIQGATGPTHTLTDGDEGKAIKVQVSFTDDDGFEESVTSAATAAVAPRPNAPATGAPAITGTPQVEQTLTADTSAIADQDGLSNVSYDYQWIAGGSNVSGATGSSYTLTASQEGQTVRVRVTFTDDQGHQETLTSAATDEVAARPSPLTASAEDVPESHDGQTAFTFELRFSEEPRDGFSYKTLQDHAFTVTGGEVIKASRLNPPSNVGWEITIEASGDGTVTIVLPITTDCTATGAVCTPDDRMLSNRLELTIAGP